MKKIKIVWEETGAESIFSKELQGGLVKELKKRRIACGQAEEISSGDSVCVIGMCNAWLEETVAECNVAGVVPVVLSTLSERSFQGRCHLVCADMRAAAEQLKNALEAAGRTRTALYGVNLLADLEKDRLECFTGLVRGRADIYQNTGNLEHCFQAFLPKAHCYDAVVCLNGYAAVSLVKKLEKEQPELLEGLEIIAFEEVLKHSKYNERISRVDLHLEAYGAAAISVMEMAADREWISEAVVRMRPEVCKLRRKEREIQSGEVSKMLYEDPEIVCMAKIEQLLRDADDMDHHIFAMLMSNATYAEIADTCYMTEGNVKYRVKKYMSICDCKSKKELLELLQEYLQ